MILLLFTASYPYDSGAEHTFLDIEIQYLQRAFDRVILVPRKNEGILTVPEGVEIDETYARFLQYINPFKVLFQVLFSPLLYLDIFSRPSLLMYPLAIKRLIAFVAGAELTRKWVEKWIVQNKVDPSECLFYTFWFDQASMGIGLVKDRHPDIRSVSRVHGYDLYEEYYYKPPYWPCRSIALQRLDRLIPDSEAGLNYLAMRYPEFSSTYEIGLMGVSEPGFLTRPSNDGIFRIVSCSIIRPVKRLERLLDGIRFAASQRPGQRFEWHHFGNGEKRIEFQKIAETQFPSNARGYFPGYSSKEDLFEFYRHNSVDVFVNVSETEGTPVAVMEAVSCGIPVIATSVGGNKEIVGRRNGILLDENPSPQDIAGAIFNLLDDPESAGAMRAGSRKVWMERYNADANYAAFAERLRSIREKVK